MRRWLWIIAILAIGNGAQAQVQAWQVRVATAELESASTFSWDTDEWRTVQRAMNQIYVGLSAGLGVTAATPLVVSGTEISLPVASATDNGYLNSAEWVLFYKGYSERLRWDGGADDLDVAAAWSSLELATEYQAIDSNLTAFIASSPEEGIVISDDLGVFDRTPNNSTNWDTAYTERNHWSGLYDDLDSLANAIATLGLATTYLPLAGGTLTGALTVGDTGDETLTVLDNIYIGQGSNADDDYAYFDAGGQYLKWDNAASRFLFSTSVGTNYNVYIGNGSASDDDYVLFDAGGESLGWDDNPGIFLLSDDLSITGYITSTLGAYPVGGVFGGDSSTRGSAELTGHVLAAYDIGGSGGGLGEYQNMMTYSEDFTETYFSDPLGRLTCTADNAEAPDGTTTADTVNWDTSNGILRRSVTLAASTNYTVSFWAKKSSGTGTVTVDLGDGTGKNFGIGTEWRRYYGTMQRGGSNHIDFQYASTGSFVFWGIQILLGDYPLTYCGTYGTAITQAAGLTTKAARITGDGSVGGNLVAGSAPTNTFTCVGMSYGDLQHETFVQTAAAPDYADWQGTKCSASWGWSPPGTGSIIMVKVTSPSGDIGGTGSYYVRKNGSDIFSVPASTSDASALQAKGTDTFVETDYISVYCDTGTDSIIQVYYTLDTLVEQSGS